jgi:pyrimidine-nucleoside phosphorylase
MFIPSELIKRKKMGGELTTEEIHWLINSFTKNELPDYQMAAWAMAVWFRGMSSREIADFTLAMRDSGHVFQFKKLNAPRIDKHSTGGVGDKTSLIIGPILAAGKVHVPMIAGRGLGHTGGTIDKLLSIPGFKIDLTLEQFTNYVKTHYFALMGQTLDICPADRKLYSLRDVTSTVDSLPLICGSIMSKKLAEDLTGLVLDIKFGTGAFMKTLKDARALAELLKATGEQNGVKVTAVLSNMNEPLGRYAGNSLEVFECLEIMRGNKYFIRDTDFYEPTRELSLVLSAQMFLLAGKEKSYEDAYKLASHILDSGDAMKEFEKFIERQGPSRLSELPLPENKNSYEFVATESGYLSEIDTEKVGMACVTLGAGRKKVTDAIEMTAGIEVLVRQGWKVEKGQPLFKLFAKNQSLYTDAVPLLEKSIVISKTNDTSPLPLVAEII